MCTGCAADGAECLTGEDAGVLFGPPSTCRRRATSVSNNGMGRLFSYTSTVLNRQCSGNPALRQADKKEERFS